VTDVFQVVLDHFFETGPVPAFNLGQAGDSGTDGEALALKFIV